MLVNVAKTTLSTKVEEDLVGPLAEDCVDAIQIIYRGEELVCFIILEASIFNLLAPRLVHG